MSGTNQESGIVDVVTKGLSGVADNIVEVKSALGERQDALQKSFDALEANRAKSLASAATLQSVGSRASQERESSQNSLFGGSEVDMAEPDLPETAPWNNIEQLDHELGAIGSYPGGHPLETYASVLKSKKAVMAIDIEENYRYGARAMKLAGVVRKKRERMSKRNKRFAYISLSDPTGDYEVFVGEELLGAKRDILTPGALIMVTVAVDERDGEMKIFTNAIDSLEVSDVRTVKGIEVRLRSGTPEQLDIFQACLDGSKDVPFEKSGYLDVIIPLGNQREAQWRVASSFGIDAKIQQAMKATRIIETIEEKLAA